MRVIPDKSRFVCVYVLLFFVLLAPSAIRAQGDVLDETMYDWQFTSEFAISVDSVKNSGDSDRASYETGTTFFRKLQVRGLQESVDGMQLSFTFYNEEPMSSRRKDDRKSRFTAVAVKGTTEVKMGDATPQWNPWTIQGKSLVGLTVTSGSKDKGIKFTAGSFRKPPGIAVGDRFVAGAGYHWIPYAHFIHTTELLWTFDETLTDSKPVKSKNRVLLNTLTYDAESDRQFSMQYALGELQKRTAATEPERSGNALKIQSAFKISDNLFKFTFEDVDNGFTTLSGYSSAGRRIFLNETTIPLNNRAQLKTGYSTSKTKTTSLNSVPVVVSWKPSGGDNLIVSFNTQHQKNENSLDAAVYNHSSGLRVRLKSGGGAAYIAGYKTDSHDSGASLIKTLYSDTSWPLSNDLAMNLKAERERRRGEERFRHFYALGFTLENDNDIFSLAYEARDNIGRDRRKYIYKIRYQFLDPNNNSELNFDFQNISYGSYKNNVFSMEFNYPY